jgi:hypothetical protein
MCRHVKLQCQHVDFFKMPNVTIKMRVVVTIYIAISYQLRSQESFHIHPFIGLLINLSASLSINVSVCLSVYLSVDLSVCLTLPIRLSVYLYIYSENLYF